eukprot:gene34683-biopygen22585
MTWDEEKFGREYDLDVFNIVAVSDFNMGAMENKGLNIFNDKYVLADQQTATDADFANIEAIIAHEYFHNWTGNRITCRDWFQLCLKEGLTVYRDHEFSADQRSRPVKRIAEVRTLRAHQFPEDQGPLAHPVRPRRYREINNFYTATVYEKGSEVVRMIRTILGAEMFRAGMDLYFERCDGTAATIEDFLGCFAETSGHDLTHFARWYEQAGTPTIVASGRYDAAARSYTLDLAQKTAPTPGQPEKQCALRGGGEIFDREVAVRHAVERIARRPVEAERRGRRIAIDRETRPGQRGRAQRAAIEPRARIGKAPAVARDHLMIGHQMMAERHRLRALQMRESRHHAVGMFFGARQQRILERDERRRDLVDGVAHPQFEVGRDLVVA